MDVEDLSELEKAILLVSIADGGKPIPGDTWLQKEIFLIAKNVPEIDREANYSPDFFGPFSENLEEGLEELEQEELIKISGTKISITEEGKKLIEKIKNNFEKSSLIIIEDFKKLLNDLTEDELLTFIYFTYPQTTSESQALQRVIQNRLRNSISLYKKGKISLSKASELSGKPIDELGKLVK